MRVPQSNKICVAQIAQYIPGDETIGRLIDQDNETCLPCHDMMRG